ncbi:zinc finger protein 425-like [Anoplophora glabripennis]|uniref:zinc finger protein 425-like n=1 Tax=Anoplophora glabripennis TaxID=217634 RepID=UPI0008745991|nr:zinc finger protein 425-like [Anoplophora glabripennis]
MGDNCRTCLILVDENNAISVNQYAEKLSSRRIQISDIIEQCVSELDLEISNAPVICNPCYDSLINIYTFKLKCIRTEEKIYAYMEENNVRLGEGKIDLSKVMGSRNSEVEETVIISDSESVQEISGCENEDASVTRIDNVVKNCFDVGERDQRTDKESSSTPVAFLGESYSCAKCPYKTYRKDLLERHLQYNCKHPGCHACIYESARKCHMPRHMFKHRCNKAKGYFCGLCNKFITEKRNLRLHILYKHSSFTLPYKCTIGGCDDTFERKSEFNNHIVTHVSYKPFICQLCKKGFFNETQWDKHLEEDHKLC